MKIVIFGLSVSSSWGNGHATIWRGLISELALRGHEVVFFERDVPYYAFNRDLVELKGMELRLYSEWRHVEFEAAAAVRNADVAVVTSYCPDASAAGEVLCSSNVKIKVFYDLDTPVTLKNLEKGEVPSYIGPRKLRDYDLVLSYTGGVALEKLKTDLDAKIVFPLYGSADPSTHGPVDGVDGYKGDMSYLGTYAADRQEALVRLFIEPARRFPQGRFVLGGAQYPSDFPWTENVYFVNHIPPPMHSEFYCSSRFTLNVTRGAMAEMGYCPSGRLFEATICGVPVMSDWWVGLDKFFTPGEEIAVVNTTEDVLKNLAMPETRRKRMAQAARIRTLKEHTSAKRALELEKILKGF